MQKNLSRRWVYCVTCDIYYSPDLSKQYTVMPKQYTSLVQAPRTYTIENNMIFRKEYSNNFNLPNKSMQILYGPGRIRTNDPRHVKAVS